MKNKIAFKVYVGFCIAIGAIGGGIVSYASNHPNSKAYKVCTNIGLHFPKHNH